MSLSKDLFKKISTYAGSTFLTQLITLLASIISRRILGPVQTGIWSTLQILVDYSKYSTLGVMEAVARDIPYYQGKGDTARAQEIKNLAFSFIVTTSLLIALGIAAFAFFTKNMFRKELVIGLFFIAAIIVLQRVNNLLICILRAFKHFHVESSQMILSSIVNSILVAVLTYSLKIYGFIIALALSFAFNIVYVCWQYPFDFKYVLSFKKLRPLFSFGLPLMSLGLLFTVIKSLDRIYLAKILGFKELGLYSIALMVCSYISNFSIAFATVLFPYSQEKFAASDHPEAMAPYLSKSALGYALTMPLIIAGATTLAPPMVAIVLPQFASAILTLKILAVNSFFLALLQPYYDFLITIRKHKLLFPYLIVSLLTSFLLYGMAARAHMGIEGIALVVCFIFFLMFTGLYFMANAFMQKFKKSISEYLHLMLYCFYLIGFIACTDLMIPKTWPLQNTLALALLLYVAFCIPLFFLLNKKFSILNLLQGFFKQKPAT